MPALIGPVLGPPVGGFITTYFSWHWIFVINIPIGLLGIALATLFIPDMRGDERVPFDFIGFVLAGVGIGGLAFGADDGSASIIFRPAWSSAAGRRGRHLDGRLCPSMLAADARAAPRSVAVQAADLPRQPCSAASFSASASARCRSCCRLLLQLGFHMTPFQSGMITFSTALGAMSMKAVVPYILRAIRLPPDAGRQLRCISAVFLAACAAFTPGTPVVIIMAVLVIGGFFRSLEFTCINTIAYADIDRRA